MGSMIKLLPIKLATGNIKYPICGRCGTNVAWFQGSCQCHNLKETTPGHYTLVEEDVLFVHLMTIK